MPTLPATPLGLLSTTDGLESLDCAEANLNVLLLAPENVDAGARADWLPAATENRVDAAGAIKLLPMLETVDVARIEPVFVAEEKLPPNMKFALVPGLAVFVLNGGTLLCIPSKSVAVDLSNG